MSNTTPDNQVYLSLAAISASFGKALAKHNPELKNDLIQELEKVYAEVRGSGLENNQVLETLDWTKHLLNKD